MNNVVENIENIQNYKKKRRKLFVGVMIFFVMSLTFFASSFLSVFSSSESIEDILDGKSIDDMSLTTFIYDKEGNQIDEIYGLENRIPVSFNDLPDNLINAIISIEDERFFEHNGIDIKRTMGAIVTYISNKGESGYGGSTITQQLIKNVTNDNETSINRKIREWYRASQLEKKYSKERIFETYVNTIYFGEGSYGVEVAAKTYFNKSVGDLNLVECATLAASIQSPEATNPYTSDETKTKLLARKDVVLNKMFELGKISKDEYKNAKNEQIKFIRGTTGSKIKSYFVEAAIEQVITDLKKEKNITYEKAKQKVYTSGYKIYTTMDQNIQNAIDNAYNDSSLFYSDVNGDFMQSAMVVIDQSNGNVVGLTGGASEKTGNFVLNRATQSKRQPGSCMKPLGAYGPAFEQGELTANSILQDSPLTLGAWSPKNYYGYFNGNVTVRQAIAQSMNLPAVRANMKVDTSFAYNFAKNCGLTSLIEADKNIAPLALGGLTEGVTPLEMACAYATIANGGDYNEPSFYTKVLDKNGKEILYKNYMPTRAMKKSTAAMLTTCLQDVVTYGTGTGYIKAGNMPIAGKTGNTNDDKDQWFCGFTPYYTIACWNGYDTPRAIGYRSYGSYPYTCMKLFNSVVNEISNNQEVKQFDTSSALEEFSICTVSGLLPNEGCYKNGCVTSKIASSSSKPNSYCVVHNFVEEIQENEITEENDITENINQTNEEDSINNEQNIYDGTSDYINDNENNYLDNTDSMYINNY